MLLFALGAFAGAPARVLARDEDLPADLADDLSVDFASDLPVDLDADLPVDLAADLPVDFSGVDECVSSSDDDAVEARR